MHYGTVILDKEDGVATLTLNRPETLNAWNAEMESEALQALEDVRRDRSVRVLVITGAGRGFSSGADISILARAAGRPEEGQASMAASLGGWPGVVTLAHELRQLVKPVIGAINGVAAGAGFSIALACDIRIASDKARFSQIFVRRGLIPDTGSTYFLPRLVGTAKACEIMFTGDFIDAHEAERLGIVNRVVPHEELMKETMALAKRIASGPPIALGAAKTAIYKGALEMNLATQMDLELYLNVLMFGTEDFKEGVTAYLEKREPNFVGR